MKRIKGIPATTPQKIVIPREAKPTDPKPVPSAHNTPVFERPDGTYFIMVDGVEWPCTRTGYLKDFETDRFVSNYGRLFRKMTAEEHAACAKAQVKKMRECFPNSPLQRRAGDN